MKKILFAVSLAAVLVSSPSFAVNCGNDKDVGNATCTETGGGTSVTPTTAITVAGGAGGSATGGTSSSAATGGTATSTSSATGGAASGVGSVEANYSNSNTYSEATSTAYAPALTSGSDTCMGSSSVGGQGVGFGFSFGSTWTDKNCIMLKNARLLYGMGQDKVAYALMCQDKSVREAAKAAKTNLCPVEEKKAPAESAW